MQFRQARYCTSITSKKKTTPSVTSQQFRLRKRTAVDGVRSLSIIQANLHCCDDVRMRASSPGDDVSETSSARSLRGDEHLALLKTTRTHAHTERASISPSSTAAAGSRSLGPHVLVRRQSSRVSPSSSTTTATNAAIGVGDKR